MLSKYQKNKRRRAWQSIFFSILLGLGLFLIVSFLFYTNWKINQRRNQLLARITTLKEEIAILEQKNEELKEKMSQAGSEEYLEKKARDDLGLKKPGEEVIVVQKEPSSAEASEDKEEEKTWWEKIKSIWTRD